DRFVLEREPERMQCSAHASAECRERGLRIARADPGDADVLWIGKRADRVERQFERRSRRGGGADRRSDVVEPALIDHAQERDGEVIAFGRHPPGGKAALAQRGGNARARLARGVVEFRGDEEADQCWNFVPALTGAERSAPCSSPQRFSSASYVPSRMRSSSACCT
ncbi:MAG: hypothetical protein JWN27_4013, partial [Candidatus Eremiobacteraeota bacterium]|nr:hypothetical protein [Candidatus Eremiobacteraeota bacterium]